MIQLHIGQIGNTMYKLTYLTWLNNYDRNIINYNKVNTKYIALRWQSSQVLSRIEDSMDWIKSKMNYIYTCFYTLTEWKVHTAI